MKVTEVLSVSNIRCALKGTSQDEIMDELVEVLAASGSISDSVQFKKDILAREEISSTGLEEGIAIPHAKSATVSKAAVAVGISSTGVDWNSLDGEPAKVFFMIAAPNDATDSHVDILSQLTSKLLDDELLENLKNAASNEEIYKLLINEKEVVTTNAVKSNKFIIGVTGCPVGVAHTYMAAEAITKAATDMGIEVKVETNGSIGVKNSPTRDEIARADAIIIAADKQVDLERFAGKKVIFTGVKPVIKNAKNFIDKALSDNTPIYSGTGKTEESTSTGESKNLYKFLMNGVSHMIPFVVIGGLLIAISLAVGGKPTPGGLQIPDGSFWNQILNIGVTGFTLMIPILAGYIAYAIGDKPALAPGMIGGWIANNGSFYGAEAGTGFIGAIIAGFIVGYFVKWIKSINFPKFIEPIVPIMIIPITSTLFIGAIFILIIGAPIATLMTTLNSMLVSMSAGSILLIGLIIGLMQGFDMGGPFGKVAFMFSVGLIAEGQTQFMGAQAMAIPVAPLGMGLATFLSKKSFKKEEIANGKAAIAMGMVGISEGAIPFAASDPFTVIPANMIGSAVACILGFSMGITNSVAHGGPILLLLGVLNKPFLAILCMLAGTLTTAVVAITLKNYRIKRENTKKKLVVA